MKKCLAVSMWAATLMSSLPGAAAELGRPILGHIPSSEPGALLRMAGIPGAAFFQPMPESGAVFERIAVSPGQDYALAIRASDRATVVVRLDRTEAEPEAPLAAPGAERIAISRNGAFAALYSRVGESIQLIGGLPDHPAYQRSIGTAALSGGAGTMAVSDDGSMVLAGSAATPEEVFILTENAVGRLSLPSPVAGMVFRPGLREAVILAGAEVFLAVDLAGRPRYRSLAGTGQGLASPVAVEFSRDGRRLYIADPGASGVHILGPDFSPAGTVTCDCKPSGLQPLNGNSVFWIGSSSAGIPQILDDDSAGAPRVVVVPPRLPATN